VFENEVDAALPGPTLRTVDTQNLPLRYQPGGTVGSLRCGTMAFAVRDTVDFSIEIRGVTVAGADVRLVYEMDRTQADVGDLRAELPLATVRRAGSPYEDVRLDLAADVALLGSQPTLAGITSVTLRGDFTLGNLELRDRVPRD
jgi:hypothetical protein